MEDLVLLRDLIKSSARGQTIDLNVLFRHLNFDSLFECVVARATSPCSAEAVARAYNFLGIKTVSACANSASELSAFTRRYTKRLLTHLHLDVKPLEFDPFHREMGKVSNLARVIANTGTTSRPFGSVDYAARPASIVHSERLSRWRAARNATQ